MEKVRVAAQGYGARNPDVHSTNQPSATWNVNRPVWNRGNRGDRTSSPGVTCFRNRSSRISDLNGAHSNRSQSGLTKEQIVAIAFTVTAIAVLGVVLRALLTRS